MIDPMTLSYTIAGLTFLFWFWNVPLNQLRRDAYRNRIRSIRDNLFDAAAEHPEGFKAAAYLQARQFLNGLLRASNLLSPLNMVIIVCCEPMGEPAHASPKLDGLLADEARKAIRLAVMETAWLVFLRPLGLLLFAAFAVCFYVKRALRTVQDGLIALLETGLYDEFYPYGAAQITPRTRAILQRVRVQN